MKYIIFISFNNGQCHKLRMQSLHLITSSRMIIVCKFSHYKRIRLL